MKVNSGSTLYLDVSFYNRDGVLVTPASAEYKIDSGATSVKGTTSLTPAQTVAIELTASDNTLINFEDQLQRNVITVNATLNGGDSLVQTFIYYIVNPN